MKKLMITAALVLGSLTAINAQESAMVDEATTVSKTLVAQDFQVVELKDVPRPVLEAVAKDYKDARIAKAWKNEKEEYKIELVNSDRKPLTVHVNSKGEWINKE